MATTDGIAGKASPSLLIVLDEDCHHRLDAERDLAVLEEES
jgi:hypothetical protein